MPERKSPQEKKQLSLAKDRRNVYGENDKASRNAIPQGKARGRRWLRRTVDQALSSGTGAVDEDVVLSADDTAAAAQAVFKRRHLFRKLRDRPLGEVLDRREHRQHWPPLDKRPEAAGEIMWIELKQDLAGPARIGRVTRSKTGMTLYYRGRAFRSLRGAGFKANYYELGTGKHYWISGCHKDGKDALYSTAVEIDEDVRVEYWTVIRRKPEMAHVSVMKVAGKYSR